MSAQGLASYRPVSLTSCIAKLFGRNVNARRVWPSESRQSTAGYNDELLISAFLDRHSAISSVSKARPELVNRCGFSGYRQCVWLRLRWTHS